MENVKKEVNGMDEVSVFVKNYKLTQRAKFLYENGFCDNGVQVESISSDFLDVTHADGFKGFSVFIDLDGNLYVSKPETDEQDNAYSYKIYKIVNTSESDFNDLVKIIKKENKLNPFNILKIVTIVLMFLGVFVFLLDFVTNCINYGFFVGIAQSSLTMLFCGILVGITALLFKRK